MLKCWAKNPNDRPTFNDLRKTMKDMGRNHEVKEPIKNINFFLEKKCVENTKIYLQYKMLQKQDIQCVKLRAM